MSVSNGINHLRAGSVELVWLVAGGFAGALPMADRRLWALAGLLGVLGSTGHYLLIQA